MYRPIRLVPARTTIDFVSRRMMAYILSGILIVGSLAMLGMRFYGIAGIFAAYALANIISGIFGYVWARRNAHRLCQRAASRVPA